MCIREKLYLHLGEAYVIRLSNTFTNGFSCFVSEKDPRIVRNIMEDKTLMSIAWQIAKGMEHLAAMKVNSTELTLKLIKEKP